MAHEESPVALYTHSFQENIQYRYLHLPQLKVSWVNDKNESGDFT